MVALEDTFQTRLDEKAFAGAHDVGQLRALVEEAFRGTAAPVEPLEFPAWNRSLPARLARRVALSGFILPLARVLAWVHVVGRQHLAGLEGPVIFASNPRHRDDRVAAGRAGRARAAGGSRPSVPSHVARGATRTASSGSPLRTSARRYRHSSDTCTGAAGATSRSTGHQYGHVRQTLDQRERSGLGLVCSSTRVARRRTTAATRERAWAFPIGRSGRHEQLPCTAPSSGSARIMLEIGPRTKRSPAENSTSSSGKFRKPSRI
jgi:hypothetical protein